MNILLVGACGRMGHMVSELAQEEGAAIACGVDLFPLPMPYPVYKNVYDVKENCDVIIDFSSAQGVEERLRFAEERQLPILLAATGYTQEDEALIAQYSQRIPIFRTGNLSIGINLMQLLVEKAAEVLGDAFDVEIIERHHNQKKDAPSGTALMLSESVQKAGEKQNVYGRHGMVGARAKSEIGIHAVRGGTIVGEHEVMFAGEDEIITVSHSARSRKVFAMGALRAARWLTTQKSGLYNMKDMLRS